MGELLMDIQLDEPTIEYATPVLASEPAPVAANVSPVQEKVQRTSEPFMVYQVPEPTIIMPEKELSDSIDEANYDKYLDYQDYLLDLYGAEWARSVTAEQMREYILLYCNSHEDATEADVIDKFAPQEETQGIAR